MYSPPVYSDHHPAYSPSAPVEDGDHDLNPTINTNYPSLPRYSTTPIASGRFSSSINMPVPGSIGRSWSTGLCHCCDHPAICFMTCLCPCITFGQVANIVSEGSKQCTSSGMVYGLLLLTGLASMYSCFFRSKMRAQHDLAEEPCPDCLVHFCCPICALSQESRELKNLGFDMGIGWEANKARREGGRTIPPRVPPGMAR